MGNSLDKKLRELRKQINCDDMLFTIVFKKGKFKIVSVATKVELNKNCSYGDEDTFVEVKRQRINKKEEAHFLNYLG